MRCLSCDKNLNDKEATRKSKATGSFLDLCNRCLGHTEIDYEENEDASSHEYEPELIQEIKDD